MSGRVSQGFRRQGLQADQMFERVLERATERFDPDMWAAMDRRDNAMVEEEILHGAGSSKFVYSFNNGSGNSTGVSVVGARELAAHYQGIKHRLMSSILKTGSLMVIESFDPVAIQVQSIEALADEPDFYKVRIEVSDIKTGNTLQIEKRELRYERRSATTLANNPSLDEYFERQHFDTIAQSKAYRNGVLSLIPQSVVIRWKEEMLKLDKKEVITESVLDEKRAGVIRYATAKGIGLDRHAVESLTMNQIAGLSDAAHEGKTEQFLTAAQTLGITIAATDASGKPLAAIGRTISTPAAKPPRQPAEAAARRKAPEPPPHPGERQATDPNAGRPAGQDQAGTANAAQDQGSGATEQAEQAGQQQEFDVYATDEVGDAVPTSQENPEPLAFLNPVRYAEWLRDYLTQSRNPRAVWQNNLDSIELAMQFPGAREIIESIPALPKLADEDEATEPAEQPTEQAEPPPITMKLKVSSGAPEWQKYVAEAGAELETITTEDALARWEARNSPTYTGLIFGNRVKTLIDKARARITGQTIDRDMERALDLVRQFDEAADVHAVNGIKDHSDNKVWLDRVAQERQDIRTMLETAYKAAVERTSPSHQQQQGGDQP